MHTVPLLKAAEIIGSQIEGQKQQIVLYELLQKVGQLMTRGSVIESRSTDQPADGTIIEDTRGYGTLTVRPEFVTVAIREQPTMTTPTELFHDMLEVWATYRQPS